MVVVVVVVVLVVTVVVAAGAATGGVLLPPPPTSATARPTAPRTTKATAAARSGDRLRRRAMTLVGCSAGVIARVAGAAVLPARSSVERSAETKAAQL